MHDQLSEDFYPNLSSAVEEIQRQIAQGYSVIWNCNAVDKLCFCVEDIFNHGLKEGLLSWASNNQVSFWSLANKITCKKDIEDINRLQLKTDKEKCMAWIRQALKENTLSSYLNVITQDDKLLREFYHPHAFLCDAEKAERTITLITYGISHLDFDISLTSSSRRPEDIEGAAALIAALDARLSHLPGRTSLINGYGSPSSSWNGHEHAVHLSSQEPGVIKTEGTGKKRKKRKKAEVVLIAESEDFEESDYIKKVIDMQRDVDSTDSDKESKLSSNVNVDHDQTSGNRKTGNASFSGLNAEGDTSSEISLTMELPVTETALQQIITDKCQESSGNVSCSDETLPSDVVSEEGAVTVNGAPCEENIPCGDDVESTDEDSHKEIDLKTEQFDSKIEEVSDGKVTHQLSESQQNIVECTSSTNLPEMAASQNPFEGAEDVEIKSASHNAAQDEVVEKDTETAEYHATLAAFECGTPKKVDSIWQIERERGMSTELNASYEGEDLNIVPGIHKSRDSHSRSESSGSFNESGSFPLDSQRHSRHNTMDSMNRTSTLSSTPTGSWPGRSGFSSRKSSKADVSTGSPSSEGQFSEYEMFDELLGLEEDHFSPPESFMGVSTAEELRHAISACKDLINTTREDSEEKKKLITKLVQLRLKLQETQDSKSASDSKVGKVLGHTFTKEEERGKKLSCDKCGKTIWMWQSLFTCNACNYHSHRRCLELIRRPCASRKVSVSTYNLSICPETGLSSQQYKCAECRKQIASTRGERSEARLCDYTGQYFCEECHWNDLVVIPARVVHNWDFSLYRVSRQSKQLLALMLGRPLLKIERLNPALFKFVVELREVKRLREEILIMKKYFVTCREALESKLLLQLKGRQHFVDSSNIYSLQDLIDVNSGLLLPFLTKTHSLFLTHIKSDCQLCQAKGFVCELCGKDEIIFGFDPHATQCKQCRTVFHKVCFKFGVCPKCERRQKRSQTS